MTTNNKIINKTNLTKKLKQEAIYYTPKEAFINIFKDICAGVDLSKARNIYDPTCGVGNLFYVADDVLQKPDLPKFGQDINLDQLQIAKHNHPSLRFACADVLLEPAYFEDEADLNNPLAAQNSKFDLIVANYPFSIGWQPDELKDDPRFRVAPALAPKSKADYAFLLHIVHMLVAGGVAVVICFPGILYRGNAEAKIRRYLVEQGLIHKIYSIKAGTFEDTTINTVALLIRKPAQKQQPLIEKIEFKDENDNYFSIAVTDVLADTGCTLSPSKYSPKEEKPAPTAAEIIALNDQVRASLVNRLMQDLELDIWLQLTLQNRSKAQVLAFLFMIRRNIRNLARSLL